MGISQWPIISPVAPLLRRALDFRTYDKLANDESLIFDWMRHGLIVTGNGNYRLRRNGLDQFVNHMATDEPEAHVFRRRVRGN